MTSDVTPAADDPQAPEWSGLSWSRWQDFDEAHRGKVIPATPGPITSALVVKEGICLTAETRAHGVLVPAFAGTTCFQL